MTSSDPDAYNELESAATSSGAAPAKPRSGLLWLIPFLIVAGVAAFAIPEVLKQIYFMEEEAKARSGPNVVGSRTDAKPPPGVSTDPYASLGGGGGGNAEAASKSDAADAADAAKSDQADNK
jgi:hypothetical protein